MSVHYPDMKGKSFLLNDIRVWELYTEIYVLLRSDSGGPTAGVM